jgi:hypothetical protein
MANNLHWKEDDSSKTKVVKRTCSCVNNDHDDQLLLIKITHVLLKLNRYRLHSSLSVCGDDGCEER